jgi:glycosyltransferase involved in cell wall biosynthesis
VSSSARISACVIAFQEADRIGDCLRSLAFCDEIVVVDSGSTDGTQDIARGLGAVVVEHAWPGFGPQKDFCARHAAHDWILQLDADERVSRTLRHEIESLRESGLATHSGWDMPRCTNYLGAWIVRGGWYPDRQLRLYDRRRGSWNVGREPHPRVGVEGSVGQLSGDLFHDTYRSFGHHLATIDSYTTIMAQGMYERGKRARTLDLFTHPLARFVRFYVLKRGFLDGWRGAVIAIIAAYYAFLKYAKLMVLQKGRATQRPHDAQTGTFDGAGGAAVDGASRSASVEHTR